MTNQNPAVPSAQSPLDRSRQRDILAKVNAHADRSLDRVFADIDELLSDDLATNTHTLSVQQPQRPQYTTTSVYPEQYSTRQPQQPQLQAQAPSYPPQPAVEPTPTAAKPKPNIPLWLKVLLGLSVTSIAIGSTLVWLVNERKIELPNTSWLPFQSQSPTAVADANFAQYMQKSLARIAANTQAASVTTPTNPAPSIAAPAASTAPNPATTTVPVTATPVAVTTPIGLVKTLPTNQQPGAVFEIDRRSVVVTVGQKIGNTNWSLIAVNKGEVMVKRKGGEIRAIDVGQKF
ncbi:hypothetical protein [Chamaesiphon sp.]|uniref:hypothetical protein n=1 Tax=Chamaesiphon sp. TaxID=2814140 RepID=UPI0035941A23